MNRFKILHASVLLLLLHVGPAIGETVRGTDVRLSPNEILADTLENADLQLELLPPRDAPLAYKSGNFFISSSDLAIEGFAQNTDTRLFLTEPGEQLTQTNLESFESLIDSAFGPLKLPDGESYVGFGIRPRMNDPEPWHSIGWIKFLREGSNLEMLDNAVSHGLLEGVSLSASSGIVVGVPEPEETFWLPSLGLVGVLRLRKRVGRSH